MAASLNKVILMGRVGKDPEIRTMNSGDKVASFSLATSETWRDKRSGEKKEKTTWHNVVVWNEGLVKVVESYVKKGGMLYLEGEIATREWEKDGQKHRATEIVLQKYRGEIKLLGERREGESRGGGGGDDYGQPTGGRQRPTGPKESFAADLDDEIPFSSRAYLW